MQQAASQTGARGIVSGFVSNIATWIESFSIDQNNLEIPGADTSTWTFTFKRCGSTVLTLTSGSEITVTQHTTYTLFEIEATVSRTMCGDYHADLIETRADGKTVHWLHGTVAFNS